MNVCAKYKRTALFVIALAITPLVCGHAFHCLIPCTSGLGNGSNQKTPLPEKGPCAVCKLIAMPRNIVPPVVWNDVLDHVEHCEPKPVFIFVALYRSFEPGRAPPTVS